MGERDNATSSSLPNGMPKLRSGNETKHGVAARVSDCWAMGVVN